MYDGGVPITKYEIEWDSSPILHLLVLTME